MNYTAVFALAMGVILVIYYGRIYLSRFELIGQKNPNSSDEFSESWQLYYFHSPRCGACKDITPWVTEQKENSPHVVAIDISTEPSTAQQFNIRATPTAVFIENNVVKDVQLGSSISETMKDFVATHSSIN